MIADIGIPMIGGPMSIMIAMFIPVVFLEAFIIRHPLALSFKKSFLGVVAANLISTFIGIPLAWLFMFAIEIVVGMPISYAAYHYHWESPVLDALEFLLSIAWLPGEGYKFWMLQLALGLLLIPCYFASAWIESIICLWIWKYPDPDLLRKSVFRANLGSYLMLFIMVFIWTCYCLYLGRPWSPF